jgi:hypothetical protein
MRLSGQAALKGLTGNADKQAVNAFIEILISYQYHERGNQGW